VGALEREIQREAERLESERCRVAGRVWRDSRKGGWNNASIRKRLEETLTSEQERALFGLAPKLDAVPDGLVDHELGPPSEEVGDV
jgi:hypothetical protein